MSETDGQTDGALSLAVQRHRKRTPILPARLSLSLKYTHASHADKLLLFLGGGLSPEDSGGEVERRAHRAGLVSAPLL